MPNHFPVSTMTTFIECFALWFEIVLILTTIMNCTLNKISLNLMTVALTKKKNLKKCAKPIKFH